MVELVFPVRDSNYGHIVGLQTIKFEPYPTVPQRWLHILKTTFLFSGFGVKKTSETSLIEASFVDLCVWIFTVILNRNDSTEKGTIWNAELLENYNKKDGNAEDIFWII